MTAPSPREKPGGLFWLPPYRDLLPGDDTQNGHPYVLLTEAFPGGQCTLAYGTTKGADIANHAHCAAVEPRTSGVNRNGLRETTYFVPSIVTRQLSDRLPARDAVLAKDMPAIRDALYWSLGISWGCTGQAGHPAGSWRGRIVRLTPEAARIAGTGFALVVTDPPYSKAKLYQVVVPIVDGTGRQASGPVVAVTGEPWISDLFPHASSALLIVPATVSVRHSGNKHIAAAHGATITAAHMGAVDASLCAFFGLSAPDGKPKPCVNRAPVKPAPKRRNVQGGRRRK